MRFLIDIIHLADINFFLQPIRLLQEEGHDITLSVLRRGRLPEVAALTYPNIKRILIGRHRSSFIGKLFGILSRELSFILLYRHQRFDAVSAFGFYPGLAARYFRIPSLHIHDDAEYKMNYHLTKKTATRFLNLAPSMPHPIKTYKELSYLLPKYRKKSNVSIKKHFGIKEKKFVYVREVSSISLNYADQETTDFGEVFAYLRKEGYGIIYYPEDKYKIYPKTYLLAKSQPLEIMTEIIAQAALVITSGDTILREAALLGTPVLYVSKRKMAVNEPLRKANLFTQVTNAKQLAKKLPLLLKDDVSKRRLRAQKIMASCVDVAKLVADELVMLKDRPYFESRKKKAEHIIEDLKPYRSSNKPLKVLEVGCNHGFITYHLKMLTNWKMYGGDINTKNLRRYAFINKAVILKPLDLTKKPPFPLSSFDLIICNHVIEHVPSWEEAMKTCYALLKKGGHLYLATPNLYRKLGRPKVVFSKKKGLSVGKRMDLHMGFSMQELLSILKGYSHIDILNKEHFYRKVPKSIRWVIGLLPKKFLQRYTQTNVIVAKK